MSLCNSQRGVNSETQGLLEKMMGDGGRLQQSTEDQLANLAARQAMIKKGIEDVAGELGDKKDVLGRLDQLTEEMQKVLDDMENRNVGRETIRRQQRILSRMLDAQRSVRRRDTDDQRVSRVGIDQLDRQAPGELPPELLNPEDRLKSEVLQGKADAIPPAYRRLVEEYFRAISAGGR
jgi:chromosome segregation ATPase